MARLEKGPTAADLQAVSGRPPDLAAAKRLADASPLYNAMMRTTCVATMLAGGHAENALPQLARAVVNCRVLPGESLTEVDRTLATVIADAGVTLKVEWAGVQSPASPLRADLVRAVEQHTTALWPGAIVVPTMATGATDGLALRNAGISTYGVDGLFTDIDDIRAHGRDEFMGAKEFFDGREFLYRLVKTLATATAPGGTSAATR
jgi:acetylornithine deacetylase/succinyl-diaminopimelate desuccinylase-like protein